MEHDRLNHRFPPEAPASVLIKIRLKETCMDTSLMGVPRILQEGSHLFLRIFWALAFIGCTAAGLYFVIQGIQSYLAYSAYMSVNTYNEIPTKFPMISFCSMNTFNFASSIVQAYLASYSSDFYYPVQFFKSPYEWILVSSILARSQVNKDPRNVITDANRKLYGMIIEDMLISCYFNFQPCNQSDFTYFYHTYYGNCYTFNGNVNSTKSVNLNGQLYGLTLELYLGDPYYSWSPQSNQGLFLSIQNQTSQPFWQDYVYKIDGASETDLILKRNLVTLLPQPYGNCSDGTGSTNSYYYNYVVNTLKFTYNSEVCTKICLQANIAKNCSCVVPVFPTYGLNDSYCSLNQLICVQNVLSITDITNRCKLDCPNECEYTVYDVTTSKANYPSYWYNAILDTLTMSKGIKPSVNFTKESYTKINIYYQEMTYTSMVQTAKQELQDVISNFGGTVGLYIGFSFLTLGEIIEIVFHILFILITSVVKTRKIASDKQNVPVTSQWQIKSLENNENKSNQFEEIKL